MNLPNKLTLLRVLLIPVIVVIAWIPGLQIVVWNHFLLSNLIMLAIFIIASITDFLDGYIARKYHLITTFGKFADPLADKLLVLALMIILIVQGSLLKGYFVIIILSREFIVTGFRVIAAEKQIVIAAGILGKIKTTMQMLMIIMLLLDGPFNGTWTIWQILIMIWICLTTLITIISGIEYIVRNKNVFKGNEVNNND
ncbi:MAG: CDP-diacylglycerol--glycerol-3-phosphate 3-phosphatidyltransferase [Bacilli bacterium]|nr:CDP-diacylglycerol--glycerol-3-phosphate 3-phosphatidyltransferase [Bacilli bacterium]